MLYTRKGDDGTSGLFGTCDRMSKDDPLFEALGTVDEFNSLLGVCFAKETETRVEPSFSAALRDVQENLFIVQAELAGADKTLTQDTVDTLEKTIADFETYIENPHSFVIAGSSELSALLDYARAISRRAERRVIAARASRATSAATRKYLNRLSSLLYVLARVAAARKGTTEQKPSY